MCQAPSPCSPGSGPTSRLKPSVPKPNPSVTSLFADLVGQAVCDRIDERHQAILPPEIWGAGDPEGVRQRAAREMIATGKAAKKLGVSVVNGFTGSSIWHLLYSLPPASPAMIGAGYAAFAYE